MDECVGKKRAQPELLRFCNKHNWKANIHIASGQPEDLAHLKKLIRFAFLDDALFQKIGRNDPCPCGSNLKFKKCCLVKIS